MALNGCIIVLSGVLSKSTLEWTNIVKQLGGTVGYLIGLQTTHLVCAPGNTGQIPSAIENNVHIVTEEWLLECQRTNSRALEKKYELPVKQPTTRQVGDARGRFGSISLSSSSEADAHVPGGKLQVYKASDPTQPAFPSEYEIIKREILQLADLAANSNKFYSLELHEGGGKHRIFTHYGRTGDVDGNPQAGTRQVRHAGSRAQAEAAYEKIKAEKVGKGYRPVQLLSSNIGSDKARQLYAKGSGASEVEEDTSSRLPPAVAKLVSDIYREANLALASSVSGKITANGIETPLGVLQMEQVLEGEDTLGQIGACLKEGGNREWLGRLSGAFFTIIPHKIGRSASAAAEAIIDSEKKYEQWQETIQLMKDMLNVQRVLGELSGLSALDMKYAALRCEISALEPASKEFQEVEQQVQQSIVQKPEKDLRMSIAAIFKVSRAQEEEAWAAKSRGDKSLLYHGSRFSNFVGLLSRGLLMPKVVVGKGGKRTDAGNLGNGIYFAGAASASAQYTQPCEQGYRLMLANDVSLGSVKEYRERQVGLSAPPPGYDSVRGVPSHPFDNSFFEDDEYVVFDPSQQKMRYLIAFTLGSEPAVAFPGSESSSSFDSSFVPSSQPSSFDMPSASVGSDSLSRGWQIVPESGSVGSSFGSSGSAPADQDVPTDLREIREREDDFRSKFVKDRSDPSLDSSSMAHLVRVYDQFPQLFKAVHSSPLPLVLQKAQAQGRDPTIDNQMAFQRAYESTCGMFRGMNWNNVFMAGGIVLMMMGASRGPAQDSSDIDLFLYGLSEQQAEDKVRHIVDVVTRNANITGDAAVIRTQHALTILGEYPRRHVQVILRLYKNPAEVLMGFDIDCCCVGYDGATVYALPRAVRAINTRTNVVDMSRRSLTYEARLYKYSKRGYAVGVPGFDPSKVDRNLFTYPASTVKGLAKLLIWEHEENTGAKMVPFSHKPPTSSLARKVERQDKSASGVERLKEFEERSVEDSSDYDNVMIPWGPQWTSALILRYLMRDDQGVYFANKKRDPTSHKHVFVSGVEGALSGTSCWCSECKTTGSRGFGEEPDKVRGPIQWTTADPGRQLLTGSFHPVSDSEWFHHATTPLHPTKAIRVPLSGKKKPASAKASSVHSYGVLGKGSKGFAGSTAATRPSFSFQGPKKKAAPKKMAVPRKVVAPKKMATAPKKAPKMVKKAAPKKAPKMVKKAKAPKKLSTKVTKTKAASKVAHFAASKKQPMVPQFPMEELGPSGPAGFAAGGAGYGQGADDLQELIQVGAQQLYRFGEQKDPLSSRSLAEKSLQQTFGNTIPPQSYISKLLLLISRMTKDGLIDRDEKSKLKDLILGKNPMVLSALEVFEVDNDFDELADTFKRICRHA